MNVTKRFNAALAGLTVLLAACAPLTPPAGGEARGQPLSGGQEAAEAGAQQPSQVTASEHSALQPIPLKGGAIDLLADDVNGDGRLDLLFTSHRLGRTQLFLQTAPRHFEAGPESDVVGFHPNDLVRLPDASAKLYLMNAEGEDQLKVLELRADGKLFEVASRSQPAPRHSTLFRWPGWGLGVAVAPHGGKTVTLLKGFDPRTAEADASYDLSVDAPTPGEITVVDTDGDGVEDLVFLSHTSEEVWRIRYTGEGRAPALERLAKLSEKGFARYLLPVDVNADGAADLLLAQQAKPLLTVLLNDGKGNFSQGESWEFPSREPTLGIRRLAAAQDRDGLRYVFAAGYIAVALYRLPDGPGEAVEVRSLDMNATDWLNRVVMSDIDGDGWVDVGIARHHEQASGLLLWGPLWDNIGDMASKGVVIR